MRRVAFALLPCFAACSFALDFDPDGLPCNDDLDCPMPTACTADGTCREGPAAPTDGGVAPDLPSRADIVSSTAVSITSPVGLTGTPGAFLAADLATNELHRVPGGGTSCALPDTGVFGVAAIGADVFSLHPAGMYSTRTAAACATERIGAAPSARAFTAVADELVSLSGNTIERRAVVGTTVTMRPSWTLDPSPSSPQAIAVDDGLVYVASTSGDGSNFEIELTIYDAREDRALIRRVGSVLVAASASVVSGLAVDGTRVWLLTSGSGDDAGRLVEAELSR